MRMVVFKRIRKRGSSLKWTVFGQRRRSVNEMDGLESKWTSHEDSTLSTTEYGRSYVLLHLQKTKNCQSWKEDGLELENGRSGSKKTGRCECTKLNGLQGKKWMVQNTALTL